MADLDIRKTSPADPTFHQFLPILCLAHYCKSAGDTLMTRCLQYAKELRALLPHSAVKSNFLHTNDLSIH